MDLPTTGSADFARRRPSSSPNGRNTGTGNVTLLSYSNKFKSAAKSDHQNPPEKSASNSGGGGYIHRFVQNQATNNYVVASGTASSQCQKQKFNFRQFRRIRSKSASRLEENLRSSRNSSVSQTNLVELLPDENITNTSNLYNNNHQKNSSNHRSITSSSSNRSANADQQENQSNYSSQVQLVGFSQCNSEFSSANIPQRGRKVTNDRGLLTSESNSNSSSAERTNSRFQTLKTSREVKMERERLRQEKLHRLTQETKEWFDRMKSERTSPSRLALTSQEERQRFFDETRERILQSSRLDDPFGQFVRDHQERFAALTATIMGDPTVEVVGKQQKSSTSTSTSTAATESQSSLIASTKRESNVNVTPAQCVLPTQAQNAGDNHQQTSAADLVASILNGTDLSKKHIRKSSSNSKITSTNENQGGCGGTGTTLGGSTSSSSGGKVRTIEIKRETDTPLHRSNSGSSDTSSGFGSLNNSDHPTQATSSAAGSTVQQAGTADNSSSSNSSNSVIKSKLDASNPVTKLQLLQERRNKLSTEHHPSFANHFGFAGRYTRPDHAPGLMLNFNNRNNHTRAARIMANNTTSATLQPNINKVAVTKSKSSVEYSKDSQTYRYSTEELTLASYGDSETESDDEDVDFENLDSVSIVAARASSSSSSTSSTSSNGSLPHGPLIHRGEPRVRAHGASPSLDSGRGDSPESSCNSTLVLTPNTTQNNPSPKKPPRPISAVPSEYSDVSTSSCRTSDDGADIDDNKNNNNSASTKINTHDPQIIDDEPVTVSIVVSSVPPVPPAHEPKQQQPDAGQQQQLLGLLQQPDEVLSKEARMARVHRVASELLSTEEQYVTVLYLIDQIFHFRVDQENRLSNMFPQEVLPQMFANIKSIYKFHAEFLLPQLRERMGLWHTEECYQRIGDVIVKFSPFFKMYTEYVKNFDNAIHTINTTYAKNTKFAAIMDIIHAMPECGNLSLQHHMLTPIQRIPRYEILLKEYLKKLPDDSPDRADSEKALHLVSTAAKHANDAMKRIEKFKKLLEVQESLGGTVDLVSPTRELLKEGKMVKISARSGDHQDRYLFLFSDLLLLCSARLITNRVISGGGPAYRLRAKFEVDNMQILEGDNLVTANTFYIRDGHKSVELYTQTRREKEEWLAALFDAIKELYQRKSSLKIGREILRPCDSEIGKKQPHLLKLEAIHKCMECAQPFSMMRKKYSCRACGVVVCGKCSGQKQPLAFEDNKPCRVCKSCHQVISKRNEVNQSESEINQSEIHHPIISKDTMDVQVRPKGLLERYHQQRRSMRLTKRHSIS